MKTRTMLVAMATLMVAGTVYADNITLEATGDTSIWRRSDLQANNYGGATNAAAWSGDGRGNQRRSMIGFDTSSLVGQTVTDATLRMEIFGSYGGSSGSPMSHEMTIHRLTQPFGEGTGDSASGADWLSSDYATPGDSSSRIAWPGGDGALGDASQDDPNFTTDPVAYATTGTFLDVDVTASVQAAADGQPHFGYVLAFATEDTGDNWFFVHSKENSVGAAAAQLIVVPEPATLGLMGLASLCMLRRRR